MISKDQSLSILNKPCLPGSGVLFTQIYHILHRRVSNCAHYIIFVLLHTKNSNITYIYRGSQCIQLIIHNSIKGNERKSKLMKEISKRKGLKNSSFKASNNVMVGLLFLHFCLFIWHFYIIIK